MKDLLFDIAIVGAGPAGLAGAVSAAQSGAKVGLLDDNPIIGGQIWRGGASQASTQQAQHWFSQVNIPAITLLTRTRIISSLAANTLLVEQPEGARKVHFEKLILATGARERFLPFPGWTLPGVMGAGGLQALVKGSFPIVGKRVVVAGSGPLLLAVAVYLRSKGAQVIGIVEQTSWKKLGSFSLHLLSYPQQLRQARNLGWHLRGVPIYANSWITQAHGREQLAAVTIQHDDRRTEIACDYLACGFGLWPNTELAAALGCEIRNNAVHVDEWQQTNLEHIYCVGEATGIGGLDLALLEGQIAGCVATGRRDAARVFLPARERARRFAGRLEDAYRLRAELKTLPEAETIVCRCEDVPYHELQEHVSWRSAKLQTRCGMGPCQGRVCGTATAFLFGWTQDSVRPPVTIGRVASLIQAVGDLDRYQPEEITHHER